MITIEEVIHNNLERIDCVVKPISIKEDMFGFQACGIYQVRVQAVQGPGRHDV